MRTIYTHARAKINLFLKITGQREDGYHTLETVFHSVRLRDEIVLHIGGGGQIEVRTDKHFLPTDSRNLMYRAAQAFFSAAGLPCTGLRIGVKKRIPVGGGMGGGSADAAAVLRALNGAMGRPLGQAALLKLGLTLGADVPFCLVSYGTGEAAHAASLAHGIGEQLQRIPTLPPCHIVGCRPGISVSTQSAFELYDEWARERGETGGRSANAIVDALRRASLPDICAEMYNDFEAPIMRRWPRLREVKAQLLELGAQGALMTGSGAVVYGVFEREADAKAAAGVLRQKHSEVFVTAPYIPAGAESGAG